MLLLPWLAWPHRQSEKTNSAEGDLHLQTPRSLLQTQLSHHPLSPDTQPDTPPTHTCLLPPPPPPPLLICTATHPSTTLAASIPHTASTCLVVRHRHRHRQRQREGKGRDSRQGRRGQSLGYFLPWSLLHCHGHATLCSIATNCHACARPSPSPSRGLTRAAPLPWPSPPLRSGALRQQ